MPRTDLTTTIARLEEKLKAAKERKRQADQRAKRLTTERLRKLDTRRKIVAGALLLGAVERGDQAAAQLLRRLTATLTRPDDQALFERAEMAAPPAAPGGEHLPTPAPDGAAPPKGRGGRGRREKSGGVSAAVEAAEEERQRAEQARAEAEAAARRAEEARTAAEAEAEAARRQLAVVEARAERDQAVVRAELDRLVHQLADYRAALMARAESPS